MNILITNDDGIDALGLKALTKAFSKIGDVYVVAPAQQCSSNSHHLHINGRIRFEERKPDHVKKAYALWGTPADCTKTGLFYFFRDQIDLVVSGINRGANVSTDIIYSGTVAAAREAFLYHVPSMAVSLDSYDHEDYEVTAEYALMLGQEYMKQERHNEFFLNVNVPALRKEEIKGIRICKKTGEIEYAQDYSCVNEEDLSYLQIERPVIRFHGDREDLDIDAVALFHGYVSVSPLCYENIDEGHIHDVCEIIEHCFLPI